MVIGKLLKKLKSKRQLQAEYGRTAEDLVNDESWKRDPVLCKRLESSGGSLGGMKAAVPFSKEDMISEIHRFFPELEEYALFSHMSPDEIQWQFFDWDGQVQLFRVVKEKKQLFLDKWEKTEFGVKTQEEPLFQQAWRLFTLGTAKAPGTVTSREAQDALAPYIVLWSEEIDRFNSGKPEEEKYKSLEMLYDYFDGEYDPSNTALPSEIEALNAGVPLRDIIGRDPNSVRTRH